MRMQAYRALFKVMLMVSLSIFGSYCIGNDNSNNQEIGFLQSAVNYVSSSILSVAHYGQKLISEAVDAISSWLSLGQADHDVTIQGLRKPKKDNGLFGDEVFMDYDKCTDGKEDCEFNNKVFSDTWFYIGGQGADNLDPMHKFTYTDKEKAEIAAP